MRTTFTREIDEFGSSDTLPTQNPPKDGEDVVSKWPVKVKFRNKVFAKIYRPCAGRESYRVAWKAAGTRQMKSFKTYAGEKGAKKFAADLVKELSAQSSVAMLTTAQADDALAGLKLLEDFQLATGRKVSFVTAISAFCEASKKLGEVPVPVAVAGFVNTHGSVVSTGIATAVEEFLSSSEHLTRAPEGKRSQLSAKYHYIRSIQLRRFAEAFPGMNVSDLNKAHLDAFINDLGNQKIKSRNRRKIASAKSRNHYRGMVAQFLSWCVRKDYLSAAHRLLEADAMRPERSNVADTEFYTPGAFNRILAEADGEMLPLVAIGGLAGLRTSELLRLDWSRVWSALGHIEVTSVVAKTRMRRLVEVCPALAKLLETYRDRTSGLLWIGHEVTFHQKFAKLCETAGTHRTRNALRHSFCTYHFALHSNENLTAAHAGNTPKIIHTHYKGLTTKAEAEKWFAVREKFSPPQSGGREMIHAKTK